MFFTGNEPSGNECRLVCIKTYKLCKEDLWLVHEAATKGRREGSSLPPASDRAPGPAEVRGTDPNTQAITWNDTFIGVSWGKRLIYRFGAHQPGQAGQWALLLWPEALPHCVLSGSYRINSI